MKSPLPARIDQYEIVDLVGEGGMGRVDRTRDTRLGRTVAIKIVSPTLAVDPDRLYRFEQEAPPPRSIIPSLGDRGVVQASHPTALFSTPLPVIIISAWCCSAREVGIGRQSARSTIAVSDRRRL